MQWCHGQHQLFNVGKLAYLLGSPKRCLLKMPTAQRGLLIRYETTQGFKTWISWILSLTVFFVVVLQALNAHIALRMKKKQLISPAGDPYASRLEAAKTWFSREKRRNEWTKLYTLGQLAKVIVLPWVGQGGILTFKGGFTKGMRKSWKSHNCDEIAVARHWMYGVFTYIYPLQQCIPYIECLAYILSD